MKVLVEFFKWDFEGEYQQYIYAVDNEEELVKEALSYLNEVTINKDCHWADCLEGFKPELRVYPDILGWELKHLRVYYLIQDNDTSFGLTKCTNIIDMEDIR